MAYMILTRGALILPFDMALKFPWVILLLYVYLCFDNLRPLTPSSLSLRWHL